jgi:hypothetical protein
MVLMTNFHAMVKNYVKYLKKTITIEKLLVNFYKKKKTELHCEGPAQNGAFNDAWLWILASASSTTQKFILPQTEGYQKVLYRL